MSRSLRVPLIVVVFGLAVFLMSVDAGSVVPVFSTGISGYSGKRGVTCSYSYCHSGGSAPTVTLHGPLYVTKGATRLYQLRISGGQKVAGGLDVAVDAGTLSTVEDGTQILSGEVTHTTPRLVDSNLEVLFSFGWSAPPAPQAVTMWGAGNSVNLNGSSYGDFPDREVLSIRVVDCAVNFSALGVGLQGSGGFVPVLSGDDGECSGSYEVHLSNALGGAPAVVFYGLGFTQRQWSGGSFYVDLTLPFFMHPYVLFGTPGSAGAGFLDLTGIDLSAYPGSTWFLQVAIEDQGAPQGVALSNALQMDVGG